MLRRVQWEERQWTTWDAKQERDMVERGRNREEDCVDPVELANPLGRMVSVGPEDRAGRRGLELRLGWSGWWIGFWRPLLRGIPVGWTCTWCVMDCASARR